MLVFTPIKLPVIQPDNWPLFWKIWKDKSGKLVKNRIDYSGSASTVGRNDLWIGLDIYKKNDVDLIWTAPFYDISKELPNFFNQIINIVPDINAIRIIESQIEILSHSDNNVDKWELRGYLHYTSPRSQWYFTRPNEQEKFYINMPQDTMWFAYNDKYAWHGTDYDPEHKKLLIQIFYSGNINHLVYKNILHYKEHIINF